MKTVHKYVKITAALLTAAALCALCGCQRDRRFGYAELARRLRQTAPRFAFAETDLFFTGNAWRCRYSLAGENDTLLSLKEDEKGRLEQITLAALLRPEDADFTLFGDFAAALAEVFIPDADTQRLREETGLDAPELLHEKMLLRSRDGFYGATVFAVPQGTVFVLRYGAEEK
jgi:hypothetical protein